MTGVFGDLFDFDNNGKIDEEERALEYMYLQMLEEEELERQKRLKEESGTD